MLIKQVFESELQHLKVDKILLKKIVKMHASYVNKNAEYVEFFGGALTGVHVVRFTQDDRDKLFEDILEIDEAVLEEKLYNLRDENGKVVVNEEFQVGGDVFNISCIWLIHAIHNSRYLSNDDKHEAMVCICLYMTYRFFTSRYFRHFKYPVDKAKAIATYEALNYKFILKQKGNWGETLRYIAENAVSVTGIHKETIIVMDDDVHVINMVTDIQGRIRDMLKNIFSVFLSIHENDIKITSNSSHIETDGEFVLKDRKNALINYTRYIKSVVPDKNSFIKPELVSVICNAMHTMPEKLFVEALEWSSANYSYINDNIIEKAIDATLHHAFDYLSDHRTLLTHKSNLVDISTKLRGTYMSSRSNDSMVIAARDLTKDVIVSSVKTKNESIIASLRTGWMLYIVLRAITMKHYTN